MNGATVTTRQRKRYRAIGHQLKPVVTVAGNGLSDTVVEELGRALVDHELIKVKLNVGERDTRNATAQQLIEALDACLIQAVGNVILIYRAAEKPDPRLSNLLRQP
jgi:RNA-binding protein